MQVSQPKLCVLIFLKLPTFRFSLSRGNNKIYVCMVFIHGLWWWISLISTDRLTVSVNKCLWRRDHWIFLALSASWQLRCWNTADDVREQCSLMRVPTCRFVSPMYLASQILHFTSYTTPFVAHRSFFSAFLHVSQSGSHFFFVCGLLKILPRLSDVNDRRIFLWNPVLTNKERSCLSTTSLVYGNLRYTISLSSSFFSSPSP